MYAFVTLTASHLKKLKKHLINKARKCRAYVENAPSLKTIITEITSPAFIKAQILGLFSKIRLDLWIINGDEVSSGQRLDIIYAGHEMSKNYLIKLAFGSSYKENYIGKKWLWKIPKIIKEGNHNCSLTVIEVSESFGILFEKMKCLFIPLWIYGEFDYSGDNSPLLKKTTLKSDIMKIRKNKLAFEVTKEPSQLHNFYFNMYVPYIKKAHGNRAGIWSYDNVKKEFRKNGKLLLIKKETEYIAGVLLRFKSNRVKICLVGVKDGNLEYVRDGAMGALYCFLVRYASDRGFTRFESGGSRPFLRDGVLQYKKKWNQRISKSDKRGFFIKPLSKTEGVKGFLLNNPFIYKDKTELNGAIFVAGDHTLSEEDFAKIYKNYYYIEGLSKLVIYPLEEANSRLRSTVPPELSDRITMRSAEGIFKQ